MSACFLPSGPAMTDVRLRHGLFLFLFSFFFSSFFWASPSLHLFTATPYRIGAVRPPPLLAGVPKRVGWEGLCLRNDDRTISIGLCRLLSAYYRNRRSRPGEIYPDSLNKSKQGPVNRSRRARHAKKKRF